MLFDDTTLQRFWAKVDKNGPLFNGTPCWLWAASKSRGYGLFCGPPTAKAHRMAYQMLIGPVPSGLELDHLCRVRSCINPEHLEPVTHTTNMRRGMNATKTHCPQGHEYTPENTFTRPQTSSAGTIGPNRHCFICKRRREVLWRHSRQLK